MAVDHRTVNSQGLASFYIWFFFFSKRFWHKILDLEIDFFLLFHTLGVASKNELKVKKVSDNVKKDTKTGTTRVWNKLRLKFFHRLLARK